MCGIAGIISHNPEVLNAIEDLNSAQKHRGPDGEGIWKDDGIALGHVRLAIIDLSDSGHQPFISKDERYALTYNGEIYNYIELKKELEGKGFVFRSTSDTEVLLNSYIQWGEECLHKFNGMFAFAIWDKKERTLFAARDHFGIKPFYYWQDEKQFSFASEIKALIKQPGLAIESHNQAIYDYLMLGLVDHNSQTFFNNIYQLPAAHKLTFKNGNLEIRRWWELDPENICNLSFEDKKEQLLSEFQRSVKYRMRSDVPVASLLSGGLDSTSIVCELADQLEKEKRGSHSSFTAVYGDETVDEDRYAAETCEFSGVGHVKKLLGSSSLWDDLSDLIYFQEEPFQSTSIYAQWGILKAVSEQDVKVVMDGQGADESLAGYEIYNSTFYYNYLTKGRLCKSEQYFNSLSGHVNGHSRIKYLAGGIHTNLYKSGLIDKVYKLSGQLNTKLLRKSFKSEYSYKPIKNNVFKDGVKNHLHMMMFHTNLPALLRYEDRNSMAFSIESRPVFLDHKLVELIFSFQNEDLHNNGFSKYIFREALKGRIPESIRNRRDKMGFPTPERKWLKDEKNNVLEILNSSEFKEREFFDNKKILQYFELYCKGLKVNKFPFWRVLNLELWLRKFIDR